MTAPASDQTGAALGGLRVVEYGEMVSAPYASKLMADLGAEVVKVEPPAGDPSRRRGPYPPGREGDPEASGLFLYLNANKRGVVLDLEESGQRDAFLELLADADVFIQNVPIREAERLRIEYDALAQELPQLVYTWITPFGLSGPRARWEADNLGIVSAGGWASITPGNATDDSLPPLAVSGSQGEFTAGVHAAIATMGAIFGRRVTGQGQLVEVSAQECIAAALELALVNYTYTGGVASRLGVSATGMMSILECKDGFIYVLTPQEHQWQKFVEMMGNPEWAKSELFQDRASRGMYADALKPLIEEWTRERTVNEVFDLAAQNRLPFAPVSNVGNLTSSEHLRERGFFAELQQPGMDPVTIPGAPFVLSQTPWTLRLPAPRLGEHNDEVLARRKEVPAR